MNSVKQTFPLIIFFSPPLSSDVTNSGTRRCLLSRVLYVVSRAPLVFTLLSWLYPLCFLGSKASWGTAYLGSPSAAQGSCGGLRVPLVAAVKIHKPVIALLPHITWLHFRFNQLLLGQLNVSSCFLDKRFVSRAKKQ